MMKLMLVFVSALALVANGKVLTHDELNRVNTIELQPGAPEDLRGYAVEAAEQQPAAYGVIGEIVRVGAEEGQKLGSQQEEQKAYEVPSPEVRQLDAEAQRALSDGVYVPILWKTCSNSICSYICSVLGIPNANCASINTCQCTN